MIRSTRSDSVDMLGVNKDSPGLAVAAMSDGKSRDYKTRSKGVCSMVLEETFEKSPR